MRPYPLFLLVVSSGCWGVDSFAQGFSSSQILAAEVEYALQAAPIQQRDFLKALCHSRPRQIKQLGVASFLRPTAPETRSLSGLYFEQRYARLRTQGDLTYDVFYAGDEVTDVLEKNSRTGAQRRLQLYAGREARTAMDKLLVSDRDADALVLPSDTHDQICNAVGEAEQIWKRRTMGSLTHDEAVVQLRKSLSSLGIAVDDQGCCTFGTGRGFAVSLGRPDEPAFRAPFNQLERWHETSATLLMQTERARLTAKPAYKALRDDLFWQMGSRTNADRAITVAIADDAKSSVGYSSNYAAWAASGERHAARAAAWAQAKQESMRLAYATDLPQERVDAIYARRAQASSQGARSARSMVRAAAISHSLYRPYLIGSGAFVALISIGGVMQWQSSGTSFTEWMASPEGKVYSMRAGVGAASIATGLAVERALWNWSAAGSGVGRSTLRGVAGFGVATAIFVVGEALIQRCYYGSSWAETAGVVGESTALIAISTGLTWAVVTVGGVSGSWAGPVGMGVGVAVSAIYSGATYYRDESNARELDQRIWNVRCHATENYLKSRSTLVRLSQ
jgi:hypothetical protein